MGCDPERVTGYVDGELSEAATGETRRHLSLCRACMAQAKFELGLGDILRALPDPPASPWDVRGANAAPSNFSLQ